MVLRPADASMYTDWDVTKTDQALNDDEDPGKDVE